MATRKKSGPSTVRKPRPKRPRREAAAGGSERRPKRAKQRRPAGRRRKSPCPHAPHCHGCPFVSLPYPEQLDKKQAAVGEAFAAFPSLRDVDVPRPLQSPRRFGYRGRVKLAVRRVEGKTRIGLYVPDTHNVSDVSDCPVHPPELNRIVHYLQRAIRRFHVTPYEEERDTGQLRYIDLRYSFWQRKALLTLITRHMDFPQVPELARHLGQRFPFLSGIVQNVNDRPGNAIWGKRFRPLRGRDSLLERIGHLHLSLPADGFSQVNPPVAKAMYETAAEWAHLTGQEVVLDAYCGLGPLALYCAHKAKLVAGIEENERAVSTAKQNARRNGYHNTRFFAGDVAEKIEEVANSLPPVDVMLLNPPRRGLSPDAFEAVAAARAPRLVYISCSPATLARDLDRFGEAGYRVERVQPFDMFPQTDQVETIALLQRPGETA